MGEIRFNLENFRHSPAARQLLSVVLLEDFLNRFVGLAKRDHQTGSRGSGTTRNLILSRMGPLAKETARSLDPAGVGRPDETPFRYRLSSQLGGHGNGEEWSTCRSVVADQSRGSRSNSFQLEFYKNNRRQCEGGVVDDSLNTPKCGM